MWEVLAFIAIITFGILGTVLMWLTETERTNARHKHEELRQKRLIYEVTKQFHEKIKNLDETKYLNSNPANAKHLNDSIEELRICK